jgi:ribosome-binding protein aMBF1 (putative translation factor)
MAPSSNELAPILRYVRGLKETSRLREKFGNRIRLLRGECGLTQEQLAERAGITVSLNG